MGLQSTFTRDSPRSPASLVMCQRWCGQIGWPQSHNATTRRMDVEGHGWYNGRIGSLSGFHSILQGLQGTEATILGTAQQFALNHKPSHLRAPADEGGFAESRAHNYISVIEIPKRRIPCSPSGPFHCRDSKQRAQGHSQEVGYYCWVR